MFREIAVVTFTAGMLGTSAATLANGFDADQEQPPPAIERPATEPAQGQKAEPKPAPNVVALDIR